MNPTPRTTANTIFKLARASGLPPNRALELVAAGQAESSLDPNATNKSSGAAGVFQLLSSGYRQRAQQLGGVYNPTANTNAILPDYVNYWKQHPTALPGEAGRDVERSGEGAGFYAKPLPLVRGLVSGAGAVPPAGPLAPTSAASAPARVGGGTWVDALRAKPAGGWVDALRTAPAAPVAAAAAPAAPAGSWVTKLSAAQAPASQPGPLPLPQPRTVTSPPIHGYPLATHGKVIGVPYQGTHTLYGNWESDNAVDVATPVGTPVVALADGTIGPQIGPLQTGGDPHLLGLRVHLVTPGNEYYYAHLSRLTVKAGQRVKAGQIIGYSGAANGVAHLHLGEKHGNPLRIVGAGS